MRLLLLFSFPFVVANFLITPSEALPFTRGKEKSDDDEEAVVEHDGDVITFARHKTRRNAVVDNFFVNGDDEDASSALLNEIRTLLANKTDFLVTTRRTLHKRPELMYREKETSAVVRKILAELEIPFSTGWAVNANPDIVPGTGGYGVVADIGTGGEPCVLLR